MKKSGFAKELIIILFVKCLLLLVIWWNFFADSSIPNKDKLANTLFGQGAKHQ